MLVKKWESLPKELQIEEVRPFWEYLRKKRTSLFFKRVFDVFVSFVSLIILSPLFLFISICIVVDSRGGIFFRQERVTQYGKHFKIFKFRSMFMKQGNNNSLITSNNDIRVTRVGKFIRKFKLDELSQLIDVLRGTMTFVGTRPEVPKYVSKYKKEYLATLLLPAGITSTASIMLKDENILLDSHENVEKCYLEKMLPRKMDMNLQDILSYGFWRDIKIMFMTVFAIFGKKYNRENINHGK